MPFSSELKNFHESGLFELANAQILLEHIIPNTYRMNLL